MVLNVFLDKEVHTPLVAEEKTPPHTSYTPLFSYCTRDWWLRDLSAQPLGGGYRKDKVHPCVHLHQNSREQCLPFSLPKNRGSGRGLKCSHRIRGRGQTLHYLCTNLLDGRLASVWVEISDLQLRVTSSFRQYTYPHPPLHVLLLWGQLSNLSHIIVDSCCL